MKSHFETDEPGGALLVARGDEVLFSRGYGMPILNTNEKMTNTAIMNTGSVSKNICRQCHLGLGRAWPFMHWRSDK